MACRRFAGRCRGLAVASIKAITIAMAAAAAVSLGGCASAPLFAPVPGSVEEQLWFDKATSYAINHVSPVDRFHGLRGYPRTDYRTYRRSLVEDP